MRFKHLLSLLSSILFIIVCFIVMNLSTDMTEYERYEIDITSSLTADTMIITTKQGVSSPKYNVVDGELELIVSQQNNFYDEIKIKIICPDIVYDTSYLEEILGDSAENNQKYLEAFKNGPWEGKIYFKLSQYTEGAKNKGSYTVIDKNNNMNTYKVGVLGKDKLHHTDTLIFDANQNEYFEIILGSKFGGAIDNGTYYLQAKLVIEGLCEDNLSEDQIVKLTIFDKVKLFFSASLNAFKNAGLLGVFKIPSIGKFYLVILLVGLVFFLFKDGKSAYLLGRKIENYGLYEWWDWTKTTAVNGQFACDEDFSVMYRPLVLLLGTVVSYLILTILLPFRILFLIGRDIIGLFSPMDLIEKIPTLGNLFGSLGVYSIFLGFVIMFNLTVWIGLIFIVVGAVLLLIGHKVSKGKYDEWDY